MLLKVLIVTCLILCTRCAEEIINVYVTQKIDIKTQLVKSSSEIFFINNSTNDIREYDFYVEPNVEHYWVQFTDKKLELLVHEKLNNKCTVYMNQTIEPGQTGHIRAEIIYMKHIKPYYKTKRLNDPQILLYRGNVHYYSPYRTEMTKTDIITWKGSVLRMLIKNSSEIIDSPSDTVDFGRLFMFKNLPPFSINTIEIKFVNNNSMFVINLRRTIDVSRFGIIVITDSVAIRNEGTKLVGPYTIAPVMKRDFLYTHLPASASSIKLFDDIGVNHKKEIVEYPDYKTLMFKTRYPVMGGWKSKYVIRYEVPSHEYINRTKNFFTLNIRVFDHVLNDCIIESALVKILLPQGSSANFGSTPKGFVKLQENPTVTGLILGSRPTVTFKGEMLLDYQITDYRINYTYSSIYVFLPAFQFAFFIYLIFLFFIFVQKL